MVTLKQLMAQSSRATCGAFEREVVVKSSNKAAAVALIKEAGLRVIGTGEAGLGRTKIIKRGLAGL